MKKALFVVGAMVLVEGCISMTNYALESIYRGAQVRQLFFSPDGRTVYGSGIIYLNSQQKNSCIWAWETKTGHLRWKTQIRGAGYPSMLSPDGASLLATDRKRGPTLWDTATGGLRCTLKMDPKQGRPANTYFTPDSKRLVGCFEKGFQVWDARTRARKAFWKVPGDKTGLPQNLKFSSDGKKVLVAATGWNSDGENEPSDSELVQLWDARDGHLLQDFSTDYFSFICDLSPSGDRVVVAKYWLNQRTYSSDSVGSIYWLVLHDANGGSLHLQSPELPLYFDLESLEFRPDGNILCKGSYVKAGVRSHPQAFVWNIHKNRFVEQPASDTEEEVLSPDKRLRAVANRGGYQNRPPLGTLYNATTGEKLCDLEGLAGR
ncbi:MAG: WD40 repeat domain-containing protein [Armatimonas sp.]